MALITVDREKCVLCSACQEVCPSQIIAVDKENGPHKVSTRTCIACGHCVAVCPTRAIDNRKSLLSEHVELGNWQMPSPIEMEKTIRSRRSIRNYKQEPVEKEAIEQVLNLARHAPTGVNRQGISFLVYSDKEQLNKITEAVICWMESIVQAGGEQTAYYEGVVKAYREEKKDVILRGAPHLVVATASTANESAELNCNYVWSYAELFAPSLGLGSCIAGYFHACISNRYQPLLDLLDLPENTKAVSGLMLGRPRYSYKRLVPRQKLKLEFR